MDGAEQGKRNRRKREDLVKMKNLLGVAMLSLGILIHLSVTPARANNFYEGALSDMEDSEQSLAIMLFVDGMSQGEAADELGVSRVTVNKRAQKIRERLRISQDSSNRLLEEAPS
jgi:DNA-directed RNA polymerase specialized sigma24 family protein